MFIPRPTILSAYYRNNPCLHISNDKDAMQVHLRLKNGTGKVMYKCSVCGALRVYNTMKERDIDFSIRTKCVAREVHSANIEFTDEELKYLEKYLTTSI